MLPGKFTFFDIETTGASLRYDRIIEIGVLKIEDWKLVKTYQTLVNPNCHLPDEITALTGITQNQLENAPTFRQVKDDILEIMEGSVLVAHNVRFDYGFLRNELRNLGVSFSAKHLCTVKLSRSLFPQFSRHNLDEIIQRFKLDCPKRHRAFDDAKILWDFLQLIEKQFPEDIVQKTVSVILKKPSVPISIDQKTLDSLPESPGVYIFYGSGGAPLYIGKSIDVKERVLSHFSADYLSSTEMRIAQQVESIEVIQTPGELGALITESDLIKKIQPLYNRKLRNKQGMLAAKKLINPDGYLGLEILNADEVTQADLNDILGIFKSKKRIKETLVFTAREHNLCDKLLGIEPGSKHGCFGFQLGRCFGACLGNEPPAIYNFRFLEAFKDTRVRAWPFAGPVMIEEVSEDGEKHEYFIIDKWCYLGKANSETDIWENIFSRDVTFDWDIYKIIESYLRNPKKVKKVKLLPNDIQIRRHSELVSESV